MLTIVRILLLKVFLIKVICGNNETGYNETEYNETGYSNDLPDIEGQLTTYVFGNYTPLAAPNDGNAVNVSIAFVLEYFKSLDERNQIAQFKGYFDILWVDSRLSWPSWEWDYIWQLQIQSNQVWKPDLTLTNSADSIFLEQFYKDYLLLTVDETGIVNWIPGGVFVTKCSVDLTYYPFDMQICSLKIESWVLKSDRVIYSYSDGFEYEGGKLVNGEWDVVDVKPHILESEKSGVEYKFALKRKPRWYLLNIVLPCSVLAVLSCFVYMTPNDSGEKVSLGITIVLSFSLFQLLVSNNVPRTSDFTPLITVYLTFVMGINTVALIITILMMKTFTGDEPMPQWLEKVLLEKLRFLLCGSNSLSEEKLPDHCEEDAESTGFTITRLVKKVNIRKVDNQTETGRLLEKICEILHRHDDATHYDREQFINAVKWRRASQIVDRLMLLLFMITMFSITVHMMLTLPKSQPVLSA